MRCATVVRLWIGLPLAIGMGISVAAAQYPYHDVYGCEANPTGNPIGGGDGYSDIFTTGDYVVRTADELVDALGKAQAGEVVFIPDGVEIDLTGKTGLVIPGDVTLAGTRGHNGSEGARLYNSPPAHFSGISTGGDNVRVTGLRFDGGHGHRAREVWSDHFLRIAHLDVRVDNCEIYNFSALGIRVDRGATGAQIHHNYLHHIQRDGAGYPVSVGASDTRIIANKFDYGRHHVACAGEPGMGYQFAWNWIGPNATSFQVDMHGGRDRADGTDIAGDWMHVHHNTFLATGHWHVGIRGKPSQGAEIHNNWFAQPHGSASVLATGNTRVYNNVSGPDREPQPYPYEIVGLAEGIVPATEALEAVTQPVWLSE